MKIMPKLTKEEKYRWIKPILDKEISIRNMAKVCPFSERSMIRMWNNEYNNMEHCGLNGKTPNEILGLSIAQNVCG